MTLLWNRALGHGALLLSVLLMGCLHQQQVPPLAPQAKTPNIYVPPPTDANLPPMKEGDTPPNLTDAKPVSAAEEEVKPKKKTKRLPPPPAPPVTTPIAATVAAEPAPGTTPAAAVGALAPGGGSADPKNQQEVVEKIAAVEKRIGDLPSGTADKEQKQVAKVRLFLKEASNALKGGDAEGAGILATKADLLMDDLTK